MENSVNAFSRNDDAAADPIAIIFLVAITIILALLVLLMINVQFSAWTLEKEIPHIFIITSIESTDELTGHHNFDSRVILLHTGEIAYQNRNLTAEFFRNGLPVYCSVRTMNGHDFIETSHWGVQWMGGTGCSGATWSPGERICIDFTDGTFHPGDRIEADILDKNRNVILSRHEFMYT